MGALLHDRYALGRGLAANLKAQEVRATSASARRRLDARATWLTPAIGKRQMRTREGIDSQTHGHGDGQNKGKSGRSAYLQGFAPHFLYLDLII